MNRRSPLETIGTCAALAASGLIWLYITLQFLLTFMEG